MSLIPDGRWYGPNDIRRGQRHIISGGRGNRLGGCVGGYFLLFLALGPPQATSRPRPASKYGVFFASIAGR